MSLNQLLAELSQRGIKLWVEGEQLGIRAPKGALTPELRHQLSASKPAILALLRNQSITSAVAALPTIVPQPEQRHEPFPLTDMQHAFWVGRMGVMELGDVANHGYYELEGQGPISNLELLNRGLQQLIERHDMLRAVMLPDGRQQILETVPAYQIAATDLRGQEASAVEAHMMAVRQEMSHQVLSAEQWPLFEFRASILDQQRVRLHVSYDLQIFDAWSLFLLFEEWFELCQDAHDSLPSLELSFRDYVLAQEALQETDIYQRSQTYWHERLDQLPPAPELPLAQNPTALKQHKNQRFQGRLDLEPWRSLKQRAMQQGVTPSGILLAAFAEVLTRWSKHPRFTLNLALFNRLPLHPQINQILGDFTSVTLLEIDNSAAEPFQERAVAIQKQLWQDLEHRHFSGVRVMRELNRKHGGKPVALPIVFTSTLGFDTLGQDNTAFTQFGEVVYGISQASQVWLDHQVTEAKGVLKFNWDVVEGLFPAGMMAAMFASYCELLQQLATTDSLWQEITPLSLPAEQQAQRMAINDTRRPIPEQLLQSLFAEQVPHRPHATAVVTPERRLTYQELFERSNQVGHQLRTLGVVPNQLVAVVMEKGWEQVVAVMGILAAGAAYVPMDANSPPDRLQYLLANSDANIILTQSGLDKRLLWPQGVMRLLVDQDDFALADTAPLTPVQTPDDLAYVIYTSGSTGFPKGVKIAHRGVVNAIIDTNRVFKIGAEDRALAVTALHHDMSVYDIFGILAVGGTLVIPAADRRIEPSHWLALMEQEGITLWNSVPAMMEMLLEAMGTNADNGAKTNGLSGLRSLRWVFLGGDWIPLELPTRLQKVFETARLVSVGGPTETTLWNIWYLVEAVDPDWKSIPYGKPIANTQYHVLNEHLAPCPVWVPGELYCSGVGLAKGYWQDDEKTRARFITHPHTGERLYRTGDLGRYLPDGSLEIMGRVDFQLNIRGHRIEPGEIEAALATLPEIHNAVVQAMGQAGSNQQLVAYLQREREISSDSAVFSIDSLEQATVTTQWQALTEAGLQQSKQIPWQISQQEGTAFLHTLGILHTYAFCRALHQWGIYQSVGENYDVTDLLSRCGIASRYRKWLYRALLALVEQGCLQQKEQRFISVKPIPLINLSSLQAECRKQLNKVLRFDERESQWLEFASNHLADVLTEKIKAAEIYAGEAIPLIYQKLFPYCNDISKAVTQVLVENQPPEKHLRILEVGAGLGVTTQHLLPLLPPESTTYVFTDISNFFLQNAKQQFAAYPFVEYELYDLDKTPQEQGYDLHCFDVIVASSVLHDTSYLDQMLQRLCSLLTPSGVLLIIEETKFHQFYDLNMGLQQGFDVFADEELRQVHPLVSQEEWSRLLTQAGFEATAILSQPNSFPDTMGLTVLMGRAPATVQRFNADKLQKQLQQQIPEYMIPHTYMLLDSFPLSANGKVDRRALPIPDLAGLNARQLFVAPRTPVEQVIASIWAELLEREEVGIHHTFFDLGGDSLLATKVTTRIRETLQVDLSLRQLFEMPTVAGIATVMLEGLSPEERTKVEKTAQIVLMLAELPEDMAETMLTEKRQVMQEGEKR